MIERVKEKLQGKSVLFISAKFYHYGEAVNEKIKSYGADVSFYYERNTSLKHTVVANFFPNHLDKWQDNHYQKILNETSGKKFDYLIVIRGYRMRPWFVEEIKKRNPGIQTILYQWDAFTVWEADYRYLVPYFERTLTFDYNDRKTLNIPYAPTFHMDEYSNIPASAKEFDFIWCTNFTDEKYEFLKKLITYSKQHGYKTFSYLYISWFKYAKDRLQGKQIDYNHVSFRKLTRREYFEIFCKSRTVVDFAGTLQTGVTMRVIDALGSGKRVLTNNPNVINEPGFNARQIVIYDASNLALPEYITDDEEFDKKDYSIDKWLDNLFFAV